MYVLGRKLSSSGSRLEKAVSDNTLGVEADLVLILLWAMNVKINQVTFAVSLGLRYFFFLKSKRRDDQNYTLCNLLGNFLRVSKFFILR